jgi:hypothetical protein
MKDESHIPKVGQVPSLWKVWETPNWTKQATAAAEKKCLRAIIVFSCVPGDARACKKYHREHYIFKSNRSTRNMMHGREALGSPPTRRYFQYSPLR